MVATERRTRGVIEDRRGRGRPTRRGAGTTRQAETRRLPRGQRRSPERRGEGSRGAGGRTGSRRDRNPFEAPTTREHNRRAQPKKKKHSRPHFAPTGWWRRAQFYYSSGGYGHLSKFDH